MCNIKGGNYCSGAKLEVDLAPYRFTCIFVHQIVGIASSHVPVFLEMGFRKKVQFEALQTILAN